MTSVWSIVHVCVCVCVVVIHWRNGCNLSASMTIYIWWKLYCLATWSFACHGHGTAYSGITVSTCSGSPPQFSSIHWLLRRAWANPTLVGLHCGSVRVCLFACLQPHTVNFKWAQINISRRLNVCVHLECQWRATARVQQQHGRSLERRRLK